MLLKLLSSTPALTMMALFLLVQPSSAEVIQTSENVETAPELQVVEEINSALHELSLLIVKTLRSDGTYAVQSAKDSTSGVPDDLLVQLNSSLQSSLMSASNSKIKLLDQGQMELAWENAVEFNGADFEDLIANANFDAIIALHSRATETSLELSLQVIGADAESSGQVLASTPSKSIEVDWSKMTAVDLKSINEQIQTLIARDVEQATESKARIVYEAYGGENADGTYNPQGSSILAQVNEKRLIAFQSSDEYTLHRFVLQKDIDNDGYDDAIVYTTYGGNGAAQTYYLVSYRGEGGFSAHELAYSWTDPELIQDGVRWKIRFTVSGQGAGYGTLDDSLAIYSFSDNEVSVDEAKAAIEFAEVEFTFDEAYQNRPNEPKNGDLYEWEADILGRGNRGSLECELWVRWGLLQNCSYQVKEEWYTFAYKVPLPSIEVPQCKLIRLIGTGEDSPPRIMCDYDEIVLKVASPKAIDEPLATLDARKAITEFSEVLGQANRVAVQQILTNQGYYSGPLDGKWGKGTEQALADFFSVLQAVGAPYSVETPTDFINAMTLDVSSE